MSWLFPSFFFFNNTHEKFASRATVLEEFGLAPTLKAARNRLRLFMALLRRQNPRRAKRRVEPGPALRFLHQLTVASANHRAVPDYTSHTFGNLGVTSGHVDGPVNTFPPPPTHTDRAT